MASKRALLRRQTLADASFLQRQFTALSLLSKGNASEDSEEIRGPYGLTLLHEPDEPLIDFVFVHGLRGGSRKTWSKTDSPAHFWPKEWLKLEPSFKNVRIHTFGYNSDWGERKGSTLTVHDFGQALLADIRNSTSIGGPSGNTPIVLIGHSMGGIVIKKLLILAKQDPIYRKIGSRIHSMFFLATPHKGSASAQLLTNVLQLSGVYGQKSYVDNLLPNSEAIDGVNDQFRHVFKDVHLWSFFETMKTSLGLIVEKNSAILGLPGERVQLLNADHRGVCKFDDPHDNNYITLRNAFVSTILDIENTWLSNHREEHQGELKRLAPFLGHAERPEADLAAIIDQQIDGSCNWLTTKESFHDWLEGITGASKYFWLRGDPATGKSTIAGHIINYLECANRDCSYFFFRHGMSGKSTVPELLCSLARQMAESNTNIRRMLLALQDESLSLDLNDGSTLWRTLFLNQIFRSKLRQPHFWVIDALDECVAVAQLCSILAKVERDFRLRVFITSRPSPAIERLFAQEKLHLTHETTSLETSLQDIKLYLDMHAGYLPAENEDDRKDLVSQVLSKSNGNFLWTTLVVKELEETVSRERINHVLSSVPKGIDDLYSRILNHTMVGSSSSNAARAILRWTICACRPLTVDELKEALALDIGETLPQLDKTAGSICGNLVRVDNKMRVQTTHQTVKDYLFREGTNDESKFTFERAKEHARIAEICLKYLCGDEMKTIRYRRTNQSARKINRSPFHDYAATYFASHIARASAADDQHLLSLNKFFSTNSLTWIEVLAAKNDLSPLMETAKNLKSFMERRAKYRSPLGKEVQNILEWSDDLIRLVAQFGRALLMSPPVIQFLIPSVCPSESIISKTFGNYPRPLRLMGLSRTTWDDRLCCVVATSRQALAVASSDNVFAVGLSDKTVRLHHEKTFQEQAKLEFGEPVRCLLFSGSRRSIVAAGRRKVQLWDATSRTVTWTANIKDQPLSLSFSEDDSALMTITRGNCIIFWDITTGIEIKKFQISDFDETEMVPYNVDAPPIHASFSPGLGLLGVAYRNRPLSFWDIESHSCVSQYPQSTGESATQSTYIHAFLFNPIPEIGLAAVAFQDGNLAVFEPWARSTQATVHADVSCLAASPNGTILASGNFEGVIKLFDFETLKLLYQINSHEENIRSISFSVNGLRFFDVRGDHCNVWEPAVLVRRGVTSDDSSIDVSERIAEDPQTTTARAFDDDHTITAMVAHHEGDLIICGFEDGSISAFSVATGKSTNAKLKGNSFIAVMFLQWGEEKNVLASVDRSGHIMVHRIDKAARADGSLKVKAIVLDKKASGVVHQILFNPDCSRILVSMDSRDEVWDLVHSTTAAHVVHNEPRSSWQYITACNSPQQLLYIQDSNAGQLYDWSTFAPTKSISIITPATAIAQKLHIRHLLCSAQEHSTYALFSDSEEGSNIVAIHIYHNGVFTSNYDDAAVNPNFIHETLTKHIKRVIGVHKSILFFLSQNDWVCSAQIDQFERDRSVTRHFFIPLQWHSTVENVPTLITKKGSVVMASQDEIAVFQNGLDFEEKINLDTPHNTATRPSLRKNASSSC